MKKHKARYHRISQDENLILTLIMNKVVDNLPLELKSILKLEALSKKWDHQSINRKETPKEVKTVLNIRFAEVYKWEIKIRS